MNLLKTAFFLFALLISSFTVSAEPLFWDSFEKQQTEPLTITDYRSASCQCCKRWIDHLEKHDFIVKDNIVTNTYDVKEAVGLPKQMASCHTAIVGDYVIEGHVPANDIKKLLTDKPTDIAGLSVPQMPHGTPGMETGMRYDDFNVISFTKQGETGIFQSYSHQKDGMYAKQKRP